MALLLLHDIAGADPTENTTALLLFMGSCLALAGCCDSRIIALSKSVTLFIAVRTSDLAYNQWALNAAFSG
jgi:hypothetical protein